MKKVLFLLLAAMILIPAVSAEASEKDISQSEIISYTEEIGEMYGICPEFIQAVIEKESLYDPTAENGGCIGLMQISSKWHKDRMARLGVTDLYDPYSNILVGTDYIAELYAEARAKGYGDDMYYVLMQYNMNTDTANTLWEAGNYSDYAISIADRAAELEAEHGK